MSKLLILQPQRGGYVVALTDKSQTKKNKWKKKGYITKTSEQRKAEFPPIARNQDKYHISWLPTSLTTPLPQLPFSKRERNHSSELIILWDRLSFPQCDSAPQPREGWAASSLTLRTLDWLSILAIWSFWNLTLEQKWLAYSVSPLPALVQSFRFLGAA